MTIRQFEKPGMRERNKQIHFNCKGAKMGKEVSKGTAQEEQRIQFHAKTQRREGCDN